VCVLVIVIYSLHEEEGGLVFKPAGVDLALDTFRESVHVDLHVELLLDAVLDVLLGGRHAVMLHAEQDPLQAFE